MHTTHKADPPAWHDLCGMTAKGDLACSVANVVTALHEAPELREVWAYNELTLELALLRPIPGRALTMDDDGFPRPLRYDDELALVVWFQCNGFPRMGKGAVHDALALCAYEHDCLSGRVPPPPRRLCEGDVIALQVWLQRNGFPTLRKGTVRDAIKLHARNAAPLKSTAPGEIIQ